MRAVAYKFVIGRGGVQMRFARTPISTFIIHRPGYRPYAIPHVTKWTLYENPDTTKTDSVRKSRYYTGYYTVIWSGKEDRGLWNLSTAKHFVGSLHQ